MSLSAPTAPTRARPPWRRGVRRALIVLGILVLVDALWVGVRADQAKTHLLRVRDAVASARQLALAGTLTNAESQAIAAAVQTDTRAAVRLTSDPLWHLDGHLPWLGSSFQDVAALADVSDSVAARVLPELGAAISATQGGLVAGAGGQLDLEAFTGSARALPVAAAELEGAVQQLSALPPDPALGSARTARDALVEVFESLSREVATPALAATVGPAMLGESGPRSYFVALTSPAEARGGGGIIGGYAYLRAANGRLSLTGGGSDTDLVDFPRDVITLAPDFQQRWERFGVERSWRNADLSPDFPSTARILEAMSAARGKPVDGVISLDPAGAGELLAAAGSITTPDGSLLSSPSDVSTYVESTLYQLYPQDQAARKVALVALQRELFQRVRGATQARAVLQALAEAAGEGHLRLASSRPVEEKVLASTPLGGAVPTSAGPFAGVTVVNAIGNKTDYYLERDLTWTAAACPPAGGDRRSTQTVTLVNHAPARGLTAYVGGSSDPQLQLPLGADRLFVSVYGGVAGTPLSASLDGKPVKVNTEIEEGHPAVSAYVILLPGERHVFTVTFSEPSAGPVAAPLLPPLTLAGDAAVDVPACGP